jgi:signal transduction histidine kinase
MRLRAEGALAVDPAQEPERAAARGRTALGAILGQIDRLDRLSAELLTMTQRRDPVRETVDVPAFLAACAADWANAAIRVEAAPGIAVFDAEMIRRVLDNLIQNALRHTPDGGEVVLRGRSEAGMLHIEVEDSGPGVPEALRDTLFEPFVTGRADGTGLGLAIAREMVQAHGGRIVLARATPGAILAFDLPQEAAP